MTLRTYVEMLKFQDRLHSHSYFHKAAAGAIRCYLKLYDSPPKSSYLKLYDSPPKSSAEEDEEISKLPPSQKKKLRQKQRKAEARAKKEAEVKEESSATSVTKSGKRQVKPVDLDPHGEKLLQAIKHLVRLDADNPHTHCCLIKFFHRVGSMPTPVTDAEKLIWGVIEAERPAFSELHGKSLAESNSLFLEKYRDSLRHRAAVAEMVFVLDPNKKKEATSLIEESSNDLGSPNEALGPIGKWKLKDCISVHKLLGTVLADHDAASSNYLSYASVCS
ncbi:hypothetical protein ACS0TY_035866 [Phlomoides rotata]